MAQRARTLLQPKMEKLMISRDVIPCGFFSNLRVGRVFTGRYTRKVHPRRAALMYERGTDLRSMRPKLDSV